MGRSVSALVAALWLVASCSSLPDFAAPKAGGIGHSDPEPADAIRYRRLQRADFKRTTAPAQIQHGEFHLGALTCAQIRSNPDVMIEVHQPRVDEARFMGRVKNLKFRAIMDRECSWWNPKNEDIEYTLQHEQIHFAISEIEARRMNRSAKTLLKELVVEGDSQQEVIDSLQEAVQELVNKHSDRVLERNHDFDEDTSMGKNPERQQQWWERIQRELAETASPGP
jgi:hypothetical protein